MLKVCILFLLYANFAFAVDLSHCLQLKQELQNKYKTQQSQLIIENRNVVYQKSRSYKTAVNDNYLRYKNHYVSPQVYESSANNLKIRYQNALENQNYDHIAKMEALDKSFAAELRHIEETYCQA